MSRNTRRNMKKFERGTSSASKEVILMCVIFMFIIILAVTGYAVYNTMLGSSNPALEGVLKRMSHGRLVDPANEIAVNSASDVGWKEKGQNYEIMYGKVTIKVPKKDRTEKLEQQLYMIGIVFEEDEKGDMQMLYRGVETIKYAK